MLLLLQGPPWWRYPVQVQLDNFQYYKGNYLSELLSNELELNFISIRG